MSGSLNKATLIGHLGRDPDVRTMQNGKRVVSFSLATTESWRDDRSGERVERTEWHRIAILNEGLGKIVEQYATVGSKVYIEGQIKTRKWQDQDGVDRYSTEIHLTPFNGDIKFLDTKRDSEERAARRETNGSPNTAGTDPSDDDKIPF